MSPDEAFDMFVERSWEPVGPYQLEADATDTEARLLGQRLGQPSEPAPGQCECWLHYTVALVAENDEKRTCTECGEEW